MKKRNLKELLTLIAVIIAIILSIPFMTIYIIICDIKEVIIAIYDLFVMFGEKKSNLKSKEKVNIIKEQNEKDYKRDKVCLLKLKRELLEKIKTTDREMFNDLNTISKSEAENDCQRALKREKKSN